MNTMTQPKLTLEAYLAWDNERPEKHAFHRGEVFAMVGARRAHGCVVANLMRHFGNQLAGLPYRAFSDGMGIPALQEYILADPETRRNEGFRRGADNLWVLHDMSGAVAMEAASVGVRVTLADVFGGIDPSAEA